MTHHHKHNETLDELKEELDEVREQARETADAAQEAEAAQVEQSDKIAEMQAEIDKMKDLYLRSQAEMENLRRRTQQELEKRSKFAVSSFAQDLLPVNDNLSRAMASIPESERDGQSDLVKNLLVGLELTQKGLNAALEKFNIKPIESVGRVFDPNLHKVVQEVEDPTKPAGTIVQEWQKGYTIGGDRVLREAMVVVTRGGPRAGDDKAEHVDTTV
ncbi:MAG TPA: nucleotide exchange factor GrpE [Alphaproteobacteria bacterium]|nr:nucleotide exchange factor GrpE [Alphaproteobacteria bacterium]